MASTIIAKTTGVGGIDASGDASGVLALQTGGTTAVTIDASQNVILNSDTSYLSVSNNKSYFGYAPILVSGGGVNDTGILTGGNIIFGTNAGIGNIERMRITPAGNILLGTTTTPSGITTSLIFSDGTSKATNSSPAITVYTTGSGTYTVPAGTKWLTVRMIGGGAGGGNAAGTTAGGGGGAGGYLEGKITSLAATYAYAVGAGGAAAGAGGTTTFGTALYSCSGGTAGVSSTTGSQGGAGGAASGGYLNLTGAAGMYGWASNPTYLGGKGAGTTFGDGGSGGGTNFGNGLPAGCYGAGGGGGVGGGGGNTGFSGMIIITAYF